MGTPPNFDPNAPFDPTNVNDPRYDPSRDPRYDPRWQKTQQRFYRDQARAQASQDRATARAQAAAWKAQAKANRDQWKMYWHGQRRTSIVGPLLLIVVGVIFFLIHTDRLAPIAFFNWYAHWWPLLLILVGLLRLAEWAIDRARAPQDAPPMRYTLGGGVITLIVILGVVGFATHAFDWHADSNGIQFLGMHSENGMEHLFGQKHEEDAPSTGRDISANATLSIDNPRGDVSVTGTSDDGKLHLSYHKQVYSSSDSTAAQRLGQLNVEFEGTNDNVSLHVPSVEAASADLTLLVPSGVHVNLNSNRGDVHVTNLKAPVSVTANNGDVEIAAITGNVGVHANNRHRDVNVRSVSGDVSIDGTGDEVNISDITGITKVNGDFYSGGHFQRVSGQVTYNSSRSNISLAHLAGELSIGGNELSVSEASGPMLLQTRSRNIELTRVTGDVKVVGNHGDVQVDMAQPAGSLTVDNQNGNVTVSLPQKTKFSLQAETSDGDTHSDFDGLRSDGRGALSGQVNGGGAAVRVNTSHGDITISRNDSGPLPPVPPTPKITGFGSIAPPTPPNVPNMPDVDAITRDSMKIASDALRDSANAIDAKNRTADAKQRAKIALEQARQALKDAEEKEKQAEKQAREAAKNK